MKIKPSGFWIRSKNPRCYDKPNCITRISLSLISAALRSKACTSLYKRLQSASAVGVIPVIFTASCTPTIDALTRILASGQPVFFKPFEPAKLQSAVHYTLKGIRLKFDEIAWPLGGSATRVSQRAAYNANGSVKWKVAPCPSRALSAQIRP